MKNKCTKSKNLFVLLFLFSAFQSFAQQLSGQLPELPNQVVSLYGFDHFNRYLIDSTTTDAAGKFTLRFSAKDYGIGMVSAAGLQDNILVLANENIMLTSVSSQEAVLIKITQGSENLLLQQYIAEQPLRQQALSAWNYLEELYASDPLFQTEQITLQAIQQATKNITSSEVRFLENLPPNSYLKWYIPFRNVIGNVGRIAQYETEKIPATRAALRQINYADARLYKSGLLSQSIENHIWFIENSSGPLDSVFLDLNRSIDVIIAQLKDENDKFNLITSSLFEVLEKRSLFTSSEYLAKRLLEGDDCGCLNPDFEKQLHKYGKMAKGATAPDITFTEYTYFPEGVQAKSLSELAADYYLVVFAAGWCGHCTEAMPQVAAYYPELKAKNIEVVMVSLDENALDFARFAGSMPFISTTDYQKWDGQAATDYQVYGTPSYFLLDKDLKIVQKLQSVEHLKSWVDWFLQ